jgi:excinuclease ABC subunit C
MDIKYFKKLKLPDEPGVYFFLKGKEILYVGKATSLKDRVKSYFGRDLFQTRGPILVDLLVKADKIDWQKTDSVLEALILEAALIKKYQPKYNTREKSDKSFNYICITKEKLPRVIMVRGKNLGNNNISPHNTFGPFTNSSQLREALKIVRKIFPFLDEKSKNYYNFYKQVDLVPEISTNEGLKQYKNNIKNLRLFFEGKKKRVLKNLEKEMKNYAKIREFERAGQIKRQIFALQHINDVALLKYSNFINNLTPSPSPVQGRVAKGRVRLEAYDIAHMGGKNMVGVMVVMEDGEMVKNEYRKFKIRTQIDSNDTGALKEVMERRLTHTEWAYPSLIVVDGGIAQINTVKKVLQKNSLNIMVVSVLKDDRHKPKDILGDRENARKYEKEILLANSEAHRFAITYHKNMRDKNFLK